MKGTDLRIAFYADPRWPYPYGIGTTIRGLAPELQRLGCEVRFFPPSVIEGHRLVFRWADLVHAQIGLGLGDLTLPRRFLARSVPLVQSIHGLPFRTLGNTALTRWNRIADFLQDVRKAAGARMAQRVIVNSRFMARSVGNLLGIGAERIAVIPNGVDLKLFATEREGGHNGPRVVFDGRLDRIKGPDLLLQSFPAVVERYPRARLILVGRGPEQGHLAQLAASLGLRDAVEFQGYIPHDRLPQLLATADVAAFPSRYEGFGIAILEAMAAAVPVVAAATGGVPELVEDGISGLLVPSDYPSEISEAILRILDDPSLGRRMGERGRVIAANYAWPKVAEATLSIYKDVVARWRSNDDSLGSPP